MFWLLLLYLFGFWYSQSVVCALLLQPFHSNCHRIMRISNNHLFFPNYLGKRFQLSTIAANNNNNTNNLILFIENSARIKCTHKRNSWNYGERAAIGTACQRPFNIDHMISWKRRLFCWIYQSNPKYECFLALPFDRLHRSGYISSNNG